jgi:DNA-binding response OmpR family regulator
MKILIIEDERKLSENIKNYLSEEGIANYVYIWSFILYKYD